MVAFRAKKITQVNTSSLEDLGRSVVDLSKYTEDEFASLARSLQQTDPDPVLHTAPPKPRKGTTAYADGTNWNPGNGEGPYFYSASGAWNSMKAPSVSGYITDAPSDGHYYGRMNAAWATVTPEAPSDGNTYGRLNGAWSAALPISGGTLTGALTLNADPTAALGAATKQYVDNSHVPGGWKLLNTLTASNSATLSDTTSLTNTYSEYEIVFESLIPVTNNVTLNLQVHSGGSFRATGYVGAGLSSTGAASAVYGSTTAIQISYTGVVANASPGISGFIRCFNPSASQITNWSGMAASIRSGLTFCDSQYFGGAWTTSAVIDGFQFLMSSGNISSGTVKIYGR